MNRREISFLLLGLGAGVAATVVAADLASPPTLASGVHAWESFPVEKTASGERRAVFDSATATTDRLETHITTLNAGAAPHAAHRHPDEELIFVREGLIEATINGVTHQAPAGSVIFYASNDLHGMRNAGPGQASYFVLRWTSPGKEGPKPGGSK
ncbi:MAG TPA: cupin domain-containing protein [Steroidobacteraceae bacterium]|jgi:quercetin dioxygenase-like cupin family protein|nr:cupin domain-containing protein [Steroidobacteraceae bacterium]